MKKLFRILLFILTFFNILSLSSCSNNFSNLEIPVTKYQIHNSETEYGQNLVYFYVEEDFRYNLSSFTEFEVEFSYISYNGNKKKTVNETGEYAGSYGSSSNYFIVVVSEKINTSEVLEIKSVTGKIENRLLLDEDKTEEEINKKPLTIGGSFLLGFIITLFGIGASYIGAQVIDDERGQILHGAGVALPIIFSISAFIIFGIWQGIILLLFNVAQLILWYGVLGR